MTDTRLNRNILECKFPWLFKGETLELSLNRNILECKWECEVKFKGISKGLNRNILECKYGYNIQKNIDGLQVLIETYWNVNQVLPPFLCSILASLNRNILECKCGHFYDVLSGRRES